MYLSRYLALGGVCARRKATELIKSGVVTVNGRIEENPAYEVQTGDRVVCDGKSVHKQEPIYIALNKPKGVVTTCADERNRITVLDLVKIKRRKIRLYPVGRLDQETTGLLLLTNDGDLAQQLAHPRNAIRKTYMVKLDKPLTQQALEQLKKGLYLYDGRFIPDRVFMPKTSQRVVGIEIHSGKNRVIRRAFFKLGYEVLTLDRVTYGPLRLDGLPRGSWRELRPSELGAILEKK